MSFSAANAASGAMSGASMGSAFGPWGTALGALGGGLYGGMTGGDAGEDQVASAQEANRLDYERFLENRSFYAGREDSKHQRNVKDLQAAGLNPVLSALNGVSGPSPMSIHSARTEREGIPLVKIATAKLLSEVAMNHEFAKTERTKQENYRADTLSKGGTFSIPGFLSNLPLNRVGGWLKSLVGNGPSAKSISKASPSSVGSKYSGYASGTYNRAGQRTGR